MKEESVNKRLERTLEVLKNVRQDLLRAEQMISEITVKSDHEEATQLIQKVEEELMDEFNDYRKLIKDEDDPGGVP